jgi:hypothetical protein
VMPGPRTYRTVTATPAPSTSTVHVGTSDSSP